VASTCAELDIPIVCYSPLGKGLLTGKIMTQDDIPLNSVLRRLDRLQGGNLEQNLRLVQALQQLAAEHKPFTLPQLAVSWIRQLSCRDGLPVLIPIAGSSKEQNVRINAVNVPLSEAHLKKLDKVLAENEVVGHRAYAEQKKYIEG
jgi:pyridoxine 4-dehydrogenase